MKKHATVPGFPFVSVVTPTYNRRKFIPSLIELYKEQTYPHDRMEWIVVDDGQDKVGDLFAEAAKTVPNIRYVSMDQKMTIGKKRNCMNELVQGEIVVAMDDDDYYMPSRVAHVVQQFAAHPNISLAGSSEVYMYYTDNKSVYKIGPYGPRHSTNGAMAWRKTYGKNHKYDEYHNFAEEKTFLDNYAHEIIQLNPMKVMLVMSHRDNTFSKTDLRENKENPFLRKTDFKLKDFIKNKSLRDFYEKS